MGLVVRDEVQIEEASVLKMVSEAEGKQEAGVRRVAEAEQSGHAWAARAGRGHADMLIDQHGTPAFLDVSIAPATLPIP